MKQKRAHDSQIVRAKEKFKLSHGGPSYNQASGTNPPTHQLKLYVRAVFEPVA